MSKWREELPTVLLGVGLTAGLSLAAWAWTAVNGFAERLEAVEVSVGQTARYLAQGAGVESQVHATERRKYSLHRREETFTTTEAGFLQVTASAYLPTINVGSRSMAAIEVHVDGELCGLGVDYRTPPRGEDRPEWEMLPAMACAMRLAPGEHRLEFVPTLSPEPEESHTSRDPYMAWSFAVLALDSDGD